MNIRIYRAYAARGCVLLVMAVVAFCLCEFAIQRQSVIFRDFAAAFSSLQWMLLVCLMIWCGTLLRLRFSMKDLPVIGFLSIAITWYCIGYSAHPSPGALFLLAGLTLGKGGSFAFDVAEKWRAEESRASGQEILSRHPFPVTFLVGLVVLLAIASWWHLDMSDNYYHGPRWMGLWDNPNTYGMMMAVGAVLTTGLLLAVTRGGVGSGLANTKVLWVLVITAGMLAVGLVMSYSRGAWLGAAAGLLYLGWYYGKIKWRYVMIGLGLVVLGLVSLWSRTPDSAPWYVKRADFGRPSAQNRVIAWRAGLQMMWDHPLGVGWHQAISLYGEKYSPPKGGPAALATNDYLVIGTELGIPALLCFVAHIALCFRKNPRLGKCKIENKDLAVDTECHSDSSLAGRKWGIAPTARLSQTSATLGEKLTAGLTSISQPKALRAASRAGALVFLVGFWFDGGLFKLPTAATFWILLELGRNEEQEPAGTLGC